MAVSRPLKVFLCHASEDKPLVRELYERLKADGFDPWLDSKALLPGQDWDLEIQKAMRASDAVIVCFSSVSVSKEGYVQKEIKHAQDIQKEKPEGTIFFILLQLEECEIPFSLRGIQWGHYYEPDGYEKLVKALNQRAEQVKARQGTVKSKRKAAAKTAPKTITKTIHGGAEAVVVGENVSHSIVGHTVTVVQQAPTSASGWKRPAAPRPSKVMVGRKKDFDTVAKWLKSGKNAAITAAVQGPPGVGKTVLAEHLAAELDGDFPGGVLYQSLGVNFRNPMLTAPILERWAGFGGWVRQENRPPSPEEVRTLLAGHGAMLVVLDDVWSLEAIRPLLGALPKEACLLVTTRSKRIAQELGGEIHPLDVLTDEDALELLKRRTQPTETEIPLLKKLAKALGNHAQALDIAGGTLARLLRHRWESAVEEMARQVREGSGFGELHLPDDEESESRVEAALSYSYNDLKPEARRRSRLLGAFAPDADFGTEAVARLWGLESVKEAEDQLSAFAERGLLNQADPPLPAGGSPGARWQQHTLLRAYALALLKRAGEEETARAAYARIYSELMQEADKRQVYFLMLPDYPQLRHAFAWAIEHDLNLAQALAGNTANLQATFYLARESYAWAKQLVEKSKGQDDKTKGAASGALGNALWELANFHGEDRHSRLSEALAAYEEASQHYRPDAAPLDYAKTQTNRGTVLSALADLPGEDRHARLLEALAAYKKALKYLRLDTAPRDYAITQNNRGNVLRDLADLSGNNRRACLLKAALRAYEEALKYRHPDTAPLDYAGTQNNRGLVLADIANLPGEDRRTRLLEALEAYKEALKYRRPDTAPLDHAVTQFNLCLLHLAFIGLPGEDKQERYKQSLICAHTVLVIFSQVGHAPSAQKAADLLRTLRERMGAERFARLWKELQLGELPEGLK